MNGPDYSTYTLKELIEALKSVDRVRYPSRVEALRKRIYVLSSEEEARCSTTTRSDRLSTSQRCQAQSVTKHSQAPTFVVHGDNSEPLAHVKNVPLIDREERGYSVCGTKESAQRPESVGLGASLWRVLWKRGGNQEHQTIDSMRAMSWVGALAALAVASPWTVSDRDGSALVFVDHARVLGVPEVIPAAFYVLVGIGIIRMSKFAARIGLGAYTLTTVLSVYVIGESVHRGDVIVIVALIGSVAATADFERWWQPTKPPWVG